MLYWNVKNRFNLTIVLLDISPVISGTDGLLSRDNASDAPAPPHFDTIHFLLPSTVVLDQSNIAHDARKSVPIEKREGAARKWKSEGRNRGKRSGR